MPRAAYTDVPLTFATQGLLDGLVEVRRDLFVDPLLAEPWSCDPARCRPLLGPNLCCKVERRCEHFKGGGCAIHSSKPFACALFPLDLVRIGEARVVTTVRNLDFFETGWSRFDRDMLRCFEGSEEATGSMFEAQRPLLAALFTSSELLKIENALAAAHVAESVDFGEERRSPGSGRRNRGR